MIQCYKNDKAVYIYVHTAIDMIAYCWTCYTALIKHLSFNFPLNTRNQFDMYSFDS